MIIDSSGYLARLTSGSTGRNNKVYRNWWLIKAANEYKGRLDLGAVHVPKHLIGRKVRFKVEFIDEEEGRV